MSYFLLECYTTVPLSVVEKTMADKNSFFVRSRSCIFNTIQSHHTKISPIAQVINTNLITSLVNVDKWRAERITLARSAATRISENINSLSR
jgi:hypothetical protein